MSGISDQNPFVGPRPIQQGEPLYGRTTEVRELYNRLQARRIVVLHSPSGAGKSSLVQAGLIPKLKAGNFDVWKPIRVNLDPRGLAGIPEQANRYLVSAIVSLEDELPAERRRSPAELGALAFLDYLDSRPRRKGRESRSVVLLFDQFEELLTLDPQALAEKREFMAAVGQALNSDKYWALFIIREDYLAAFAPYRDRIPTQMSNTFRLDLLGLDGARETAEQLAAIGGRRFPGVDKLIRDLSTIQVQQPDGSFVAQPGHYVEPVHLQVVCRRLWAAMPEADLSIEDEHITEYAKVSTALAGYYADAVATMAGGNLTIERAVREWVGGKLIVGGIRSQIRREPSRSGGLDNELIDRLCACYLVRTEQRAGADWYELGHDRMVEPVQNDNRAWEQSHLHPLQVQAKLWEGGRRSQALLLRGEALAKALVWSRQNSALLTADEHEFLVASSKQRIREIVTRTSLWALVVAAIVAALVMRSAERNARRAEATATEAKVQAELAKEQAELAEDKAHRLTLMAGANELLARNRAGAAAMVVATITNPEIARGWGQLVADILMKDVPKSTFSHRRFVWSAAWSPDGKRIVTGSGDQTARIWSADGRGDPIILAGHTDEVVQARWSPDGARIATASKDGSARVWTATGEGPPVVLLGHTDELVGVEWSPEGKHLLTTSKDHTARVWAVDGSSPPVVLAGHGAGLHSGEWSPDGTHVVTASADKSARIWTADGSGKPIVLAGHTGAVMSARWSHDGQRIATAAQDLSARIWAADGSGEPIVLMHQGPVMAVAWNPDDTHLATGSANARVRIWPVDGSGESVPLTGHDNSVVAVAWSPDGRHLASASKDGTAWIWNVDGSGLPMILSSHKNDVVAVEWSPDGRRIVTASIDRTARIWEFESDDKPTFLEGHQGWVYWAAWSPDGTRIVTASGDGRADSAGKPDNTARIWNPDGSGVPLIFAGHGDAVFTAAWSPDGKRIATASRDQSARIWTADDPSTAPVILTGHTDALRSAMWSPDGNHIVTASADKTVRIWNADGSGEPLVLAGHTADVRFAAWSPDGKHIASGSYDRSARIWNADGSGEPLVLQGHEDWVLSVAWSPDSKHVVTASTDRTMRIWAADGSGEAPMIQGHEDSISVAAWSPDGKYILSSSEDKTVRIWHVDGVGDCIQLTGHADKVTSAGWSPDSLHIVTASVDRTARVWHLQRYVDLEELRRDLVGINTECLTSLQRQTYLDEGEAEARAGYEACEIGYGRTPYFLELAPAKPNR